MKKKISIFLGFVFLISLSLTACNQTKHAANDAWLNNDTHHWHSCVEEGCTELFDQAAHTWSEWSETKPATCKQAGENTRSCTVCGKEEIETVKKLTHSDSSYVEKSDDNYHWLECPTCNQIKENSKVEHTFTTYKDDNNATCEANGTETAKCEGCSKTDVREKADSMLEHTFVNYVSNNDATCEADGTETAKCNTCDETHTRVVVGSMLQHNVNKTEWKHDENGHWHQCVSCSYKEDEAEHIVDEWNILENPTFDAEGLKAGHCSVCNSDLEVSIPVLVKAEYLSFNVSSITLHVGDDFDLVATIGPAAAQNYRVEWIVANSGLVTLTQDGNSCNIAAGQTIGRTVVTLKVINELNNADIDEYTYTVDCAINVVAKPIVKYTFDNGEIVNTGTQTTANGRATTNDSGKLVTDIDNSLLARVPGSDGTEGSAIKLSNISAGGNHFSISNIEEITGDFTISVKVFLNQVTTKTDYSNYLFGTSTNDIFDEEWSNGKNNFPGKDPIAPLFNFAYKDNQGRMQVRWYINGSGNNLQYIPVGEWVEFRMVKHGTTVTVYIDNINAFNGTPHENYSYSVNLDSADQLVLRPDFILGFASNACVQSPGEWPVSFDDITIYDYATGHMYGEYTSNNDATCNSNCTETAQCLDCDVTHTREIADTKLQHTLIDVAEKEGTCVVLGNIAHKHCSVCGKNFDNEGNELEKVEVGGAHDITGSYYEVQDGVMMFVELCKHGHVLPSEVDTTKPVEVSNYNDLATILEAGYDVVLTADIDLTPAQDADITGLVISKNLTIDLANFKLTYNVADADSLNQVQLSALTVDGGNVVMKNGTVESLSFGLFLNNGSLTLEEMTVKAATTAVQVNEGTLDILSGNYSVENAANDHNYTINCVDDSYIAGTAIVNIKGGKFENFNPANNLAEGENTNFVPVGYELNSKDNTYLVTKAPVARFTFENGIVNEGTDSNIRGVGLSNATDTRYTEVDMTSNIFTTHTQGTTVYELGTTAIQASHASNGNSFGIKGINTGTGDFTISVKIYTPYDFLKQKASGDKTADQVFAEKNWQWYLFGTAYEDSENRPSAPCFDVRIGKDSNGAGWFKSKTKLNGVEQDIYVKDQAGYWQARKWIEFRVVKSGTTVTVSQVFDAYGTAKGKPYSITYQLSSPEELMITPDMVLGFGCNYNVTRPGNYTYYDDICVWDYAVPFLD